MSREACRGPDLGPSRRSTLVGDPLDSVTILLFPHRVYRGSPRRDGPRAASSQRGIRNRFWSCSLSYAMRFRVASRSFSLPASSAVHWGFPPLAPSVRSSTVGCNDTRLTAKPERYQLSGDIVPGSFRHGHRLRLSLRHLSNAVGDCRNADSPIAAQSSTNRPTGPQIKC
jgi:hypothetical protein